MPIRSGDERGELQAVDQIGRQQRRAPGQEGVGRGDWKTSLRWQVKVEMWWRCAEVRAEALREPQSSGELEGSEENGDNGWGGGWMGEEER